MQIFIWKLYTFLNLKYKRKLYISIIEYKCIFEGIFFKMH